MSAYIVYPDRIALISAMATLDYDKNIDTEKALSVSKVLIASNIKSISHRYPDTKGKEIESFFVDMTKKQYNREVNQAIVNLAENPLISTTAKQTILNTIDSISEFDYQACEYDSYYTSKAKNIIDGLGFKLAKDLARLV